MATFIKLDNDYQLVDSSVAVTPFTTLKGYVTEVDKVSKVSQVFTNELNGDSQGSNWRYINSYGNGYYLLNAMVVANNSDYYVIGTNKMINSTQGDYILLFNKAVPTGTRLQVVLTWMKPIVYVTQRNVL